jgi:hypothetical protein
LRDETYAASIVVHFRLGTRRPHST